MTDGTRSYLARLEAIAAIAARLCFATERAEKAALAGQIGELAQDLLPVADAADRTADARTRSITKRRGKLERDRARVAEAWSARADRSRRSRTAIAEDISKDLGIAQSTVKAILREISVGDARHRRTPTETEG